MTPETVPAFAGPVFVDGQGYTYISGQTGIGFDAIDQVMEDAVVSEVAGTGIKIDQAAQSFSELTAFSSSFTLAAGSHFIVYASSDNAGNLESLKTANFTVDTQAPGIPQNLLVSGFNPSAWTNISSVTITLTGSDDASGVAGARMKLGAAPASGGEGVFFTSTGPYVFHSTSLVNGANPLYVWLEDNVGNADISNAAMVDLRFDSSAPLSQASVAQSTYATGPVPVSFSASDVNGAAGSGQVGLVKLWMRKDVADNGVYGSWQDTGLQMAAAAGAFSFDPQDQDADHQFYTQAQDGAGSWEAVPVSTTSAKASAFFDHTAPAITNIQIPLITSNLVQISWNTDDKTTAVIEHSTSSVFAAGATRYKNVAVSSRTHLVTVDCSVFSPATIYFRIRSMNRTGLETVSAVNSFTTPADVYVSADLFGVLDLNQPIMVTITNPQIVQASFTLDGQSGELSLSTGVATQITIDSNTIAQGWQYLNVTLDGYTYQTRLVIDTAQRTARVVRLAIGGGVVTTSSPPANGATMIADLSLGQDFVGPDASEVGQNYMASGNSRMYLGYFSGIDPVAPGAIVDLVAHAGSGLGQMTLAWSAPGDDAFVGQAMRYEARYSQQTITEQNFSQAQIVTGMPLPQMAGAPQTVDIAGLSDGTSYYFSVKAFDESGNASLSNLTSAGTMALAQSTTSIGGYPEVELFSQVPGVTLNQVSIVTANPAVALATGAAQIQGLILMSGLFDIVSPDPALPGGATIQFRYQDLGDQALEEQLRVYHFKPDLGQWLLVVDLGPDTINNIFSLPVASLSYFAIMIPDPLGPQWVIFNTGNSGIRDNSVKHITGDPSGNLWISFLNPDAGIDRYDGHVWTNYNVTNSGLLSNGISDFDIDVQGRVWVATSGGGLSVFSGGIWISYTHANSGLSENYLNRVVVDKDGVVWLSANNKVIRYDGSNFQDLIPPSHLGFIHTGAGLAPDNEGGFWYAANDDQGVFHYSSGTWTFYSSITAVKPDGTQVNTLIKEIRSIEIDNTGRMWFTPGASGATYSYPVYMYDGGTFFVFPSSVVGKNRVSTLDVGIGGGGVWFGDVGATRYDGTTWSTLNTANSGIASDPVRSFAFSSSTGPVWLATNNGVSRLVQAPVFTSSPTVSQLRVESKLLPATVTVSNPEVSWSFSDSNGSSQQSYYDLELSVDSDFASVFFSSSVASSASSQVLPALPEGGYYVRVRVRSSLGMETTYASGRFTIKTTASSADGVVTLASNIADLNILKVSTATPDVSLAIAAADADGLMLVSGIYDISPSVPFDPVAILTFKYDLAVVPDTATLAVYRFDGVAWTSATIINQIVLDAENPRIVGSLAHTSLYALFIPENIPPITRLEISGGNRFVASGQQYVSSAALFSFAAIDPSPASGVDLTEFKVNGSSVQIYTQPFSLQEGIQKIDYRSRDRRGNYEDFKSSTIVIDATSPQVYISSPALGQIYVPLGGSISIRYGVVDNFDINVHSDALLRNLNNGTTVTVVNGQDIDPLSIDAGFWQLHVSAVDFVLNSTAVVSGLFEVIHDVLPPETMLTLGAPRHGQELAFVTSNSVVSLDSIDDLLASGDAQGLGVALQELSVDGVLKRRFDNAAPEPGKNFVSTYTLAGEPDGFHSLGYAAQDSVGNREQIKVATVAVDNTAPQANVSLVGSQFRDVSGLPEVIGGPLFIASNTLVALSAIDPLVNGVASGLQGIIFGVDGSALAPYSQAVALVEG
ncbi:MAG: hypothetical protein AABZ44_06850, partial [Elusimicrobiota bacterium]